MPGPWLEVPSLWAQNMVLPEASSTGSYQTVLKEIKSRLYMMLPRGYEMLDIKLRVYSICKTCMSVFHFINLIYGVGEAVSQAVFKEVE